MITIDKQEAKIQEVLTGGFQSYPPLDKDDAITIKQVKAIARMRVLTVRNLRSKKSIKQGYIKVKDFKG